MHRIAADIGGTFTDVVAARDGQVVTAKVPTTKENQTDGVGAALELLGGDLREVDLFLHGTTVLVNAFLEGRLSRVALITTKGFRDVLEIMRGDASEAYNLRPPKPEPLIPRRLRLEIDERMGHEGSPLRPVSKESVAAAIERLERADIEAVAVCLIHAYASPAHERELVRQLAERLTHLTICASSDIAPEWKEFERTSTTVVNAMTMPLMKRYVESLETKLTALGLRTSPLVMQSNGGTTTAGEAAERPVGTIMSGPVGGVVGTLDLAQRLAIPNLISLDMGGTSADVGLVVEGRPTMRFESELEGWPLLVPSVDIETVGAGGGSIARVDGSGLFSVGPESAGADPGPACYARGGTEATVTDAHVVLGSLDPDGFLGGEMRLDEAASEKVIGAVAQRLGIEPQDAARGVVEIVTAVMDAAIRRMTVERGLDPRRFALCCFGGAGGLHASILSRSLGIGRFYIPPHPGLFSAIGMLNTSIRHDLSRTIVGLLLDLKEDAINAEFQHLERQALGRLQAEGVLAPEVAPIQRQIELRYLGQQYTLQLDVPEPAGSLETLRQRFDELHEWTYGHTMEDAQVEVTGVRVTVTIPPAGRIEWEPPPPAEPRWSGYRDIVMPRAGSESVKAKVVDRGALPTGAVVKGPAIVQEESSTVLLLLGDAAFVELDGTLRVDVGA